MDFIYKLEDLEFEWNLDKAQINYRKHGIIFEVAAEVFLDPFQMVGNASANQEQREFAIGYTFSEDLLIVIHVERGLRTRIISARFATPLEQKLYEQG